MLITYAPSVKPSHSQFIIAPASDLVPETPTENFVMLKQEKERLIESLLKNIIHNTLKNSDLRITAQP
jgi:hypothetical protein